MSQTTLGERANFFGAGSRLESWWKSSDFSTRLSFILGTCMGRRYLEDLDLVAAKKLATKSGIAFLLGEKNGMVVFEGLTQYFSDLEVLREHALAGEEARAWCAFLAWQELGVERRKGLLARLRVVLPESWLFILEIQEMEFENFEGLPHALQSVLARLVSSPPVAKLLGDKFIFFVPNVSRAKVRELERHKQGV